MKTLFGIALLIALLGGALVGYQIGAWSLDEARAQLEALDRAAEQARLEHEAMRQKMEHELAALRADYERKATLQGQAFQAEKLELQRSLAAATARAAAVETRRQALADELRSTIKARESAAGALKDDLQKRERELQGLLDAASREQAGLSCLAIAVPADEVRLLNTRHTSQERVQK